MTMPNPCWRCKTNIQLRGIVLKIHHSPIPLVDRIKHVLRNDRERTAKFIADTLGLNKVGVTQCMSESGGFEWRKDGNQVLWRVRK